MKQIESYHISKSEYGIIQLIINTRDRWLNYGLVNRSHDKTYRFNIFKLDDIISIDELIISEVEFPFDDAEYHYLRLHQQEKDQIIYYWIPIRLLKGDD